MRAVLRKPKILFLDESTSALDENAETLCYRYLKEELPDTILISIGHRASLEQFHYRILELDKDTIALSATSREALV